ncbi:SH3 domain-containing protein, partial [bacterium]|nr:SH3 domain-containing protein [bacterium]
DHSNPETTPRPGQPTEVVDQDETQDGTVVALAPVVTPLASRTPSPTPTPTSTPERRTPTPQEIVEVRLTVRQSVNVRPAPNTRSSAIMTLPPRSDARVIDRDERGESVNGNSMWYQIELENGQTGWVWSGAVTLDGEFRTSVDTPTPTPTPEITPTQSITRSERTPTTPETENVADDGFVTLDELATFPQTIRYTFEGLSSDGVNPGPRTPVSVELDIESLPTLRGIDGQLIPFGFYIDEQPPIDPSIFSEQLRIGNTELQLGYVSGILTHVHVSTYGVVLLGVSVPIEATNQYANIHISMGQNPQRISVLDRNGIQTRSISSERMPYGTDNPNYSGAREGTGIYFSSQSQNITYPTSSGLGELHIGQQILVRFTVNDEELRTQSVPLNGQIVGSGNRSALDVISDLTDRQTRNDGRVLWNNMGVVLPEASVILEVGRDQG